MNDNLFVNQKMFKMFHEIHKSLTLSSVVHPISNPRLPSLHLTYDPTHALQNIRNNWISDKTQTLKFVVPDTNVTITAKCNHLKIIYKKERAMIKDTKLDHCSLFPNSFERQKVSLVLNVFNEKTVAASKQNNFDETAIFVEHVNKMWNILNVRSRYTGERLKDTDREPINSIDDPKLDFLFKMATSLKLMAHLSMGNALKA